MPKYWIIKTDEIRYLSERDAMCVWEREREERKKASESTINIFLSKNVISFNLRPYQGSDESVLTYVES